MATSLNRAVLIPLLIVLICGCSKSGNPTQPPLPDSEGNVDAITESTSPDTVQSNNHQLLAYNLIHVDASSPADVEFEIVPVRSSSIHLNILKLLETGICTDCFKIVDFNIPEPDVLDVDIQITHPFDDLKFTIFDVRGIMMFNGSHVFPASGLTMSDSSMGDGELLNAEGYTQLYNGSTLGMAGDLLTYYPGKLSTPTIPDADLNGFIRHITDDPANTRNAFYAEDSVTQTYSLALPSGEFVFGYAVDASWDIPLVDPVTDPMTDFSITANCIEPWKFEVADLGPGLTTTEGTTTLQIDVYDWQGKDSTHPVKAECPAYYDGEIEATWVSDGDGYTRYEVTLINTKNPGPGMYPCIISHEATENDPSGQPWLDLTGYEIILLDYGNLLWAKCAGETNMAAGYAITTLSDNSTVVTGYFTEVITFGKDEPNETVLFTNYPYKSIFVARYNPNGTLAWAKRLDSEDKDGYSNGITTLSDNSIVLTGYFEWVSGDPPYSTYCSDIIIARYNPDGTLAWVKQVGGYSYSEGRGITSLSDDSIVVTGRFNNSITFGWGEPNETTLTTYGPSNDIDIFIARYNPDGTLAWVKQAGGLSYDFSWNITSLTDNSTVITGSFSDIATFGLGEPNETVLVEGDSSSFMACYNPDGTLAWAKLATGYYITAHSDDSLVVTGSFEGTRTFGEGEPNETVLVSEGHPVLGDGGDIYIALYNPDGTLEWAKRAGGPDRWYQNDGGHGITTLPDNSTVITGWYSKKVTFGEGEPNETVLFADGTQDLFIARYNPDGTLAWVKSAHGTIQYSINGVKGLGITTLSDNSIVATGYYAGTATFGVGEPNETILKSTSTWEVFIARFGP